MCSTQMETRKWSQVRKEGDSDTDKCTAKSGAVDGFKRNSVLRVNTDYSRKPRERSPYSGPRVTVLLRSVRRALQMHAATPRSRSHAFSTTIRRGSARSMAEPKGKRRRDRLFCPHCDEYLSNSTFYRHKEAFYIFVFNAFLIIIMKVLDHARIQRYEKHG